MRKFLIGCTLAAAVALTTGAVMAGDVVENEEIYTVKSGDTLWSIASVYVDKNTYGKGDIREYIFNITHDWNRDTFKNRHHADIYPGEKLHVKYWVNKEASK